MKSATMRFVQKASYDWDEWFDKGRFVLVYRKHYHCGHGTMEQQVRNQATKRGFSASITSTEDGMYVSVKRREEVSFPITK